MNFVNRFLQSVNLLPALIIGFESIFGAGGGKTKSQKVTETFNFAAGIADAVAQKDIVDQGAFAEAVQGINDNVVKALNASIWSKNKQ
jgi:hypothetical protein